MSRKYALALGSLVLVACSLAGCSKAPAPAEEPLNALRVDNQAPEPVPGDLPGVIVGGPKGPPPGDAPQSPVAEADKQQKYDAALQDAFRLLGERKYPDALAALEAARTFKDSDFLRGETAKLKARIDQQAAAERTVQDIQAVLDQGKTAEAGQLATAALQQYGGTEVAGRLATLKLQADTLLAAQVADSAAKRQRFRDDGDAARKDRNLRAAALAYEQALQLGDDANLKRQLEDVRTSLARYDDNRVQAAELRRDPATLEDALGRLKDAAAAWDTLQVRQEIDEYTVALQQRRERVGVADFEVRGDAGIPEAGRTLADELLPFLKPKYDLVERGQLGKVVDELKLGAGRIADSDADRRELGRLLRLRYLVVGSVTPVGGVTVNARLVDTRSGLVVQTAKVVAATPDQVIGLMPELARLLLMTDEQRLATAQEQARVAQLPPPPPPDAPLPPPPEVPPQGQPVPPPVVFCTPRPPELGGVVVEDFQRLPPPPPPGQRLTVIAVGPNEAVHKRRLLQLSLEIGDNLFRRGRAREAFRHFEFALSLSPGHVDLQLRLDRCRPLLPPPPLVVVVVDAPPPPRERIAFLDFVVLGDPAVVHPALAAWTPDNLAPYFMPSFEIVDRGELFWYMGRMGMTLRDLMTDPAARRWLGRALNVRYFVLGNVRQTASFDVTTYLVDTEYGFLRGSGRVHVRDPFELKLRLGELAQLTLMSPAERLRYERQTQPLQGLVVQANQCADRGDFTVAVTLFKKALRLRPGSVEIQFRLQNSYRAAELAALEDARRGQAERLQAEALECQRRQLELARRAEEARIRAAQQAAAWDAEQRLREDERRQRECATAHTQLVVQARAAVGRGDFQVSIRLFEGAVRLRQDDDVYRELARARAEAERLARERNGAEQARREAELRRLQEAEVARTREQLEKQRRQQLAEELARRKRQEETDRVAYQQLCDEGQRLLNREQYDAAIGVLQSARRLRKTDAVEALLNQALVGQARAQAAAQGEVARRDLERQLAAEKERRFAAEAEAKRNQDLYAQALQLAQQAMAAKNYDAAAAQYEQAGKVYRTDAVLTGLRQAQAARTEARTQAALVTKKQAEGAQQATEATRLVGEGQAALAAGNHDRAVQSFTAAKALAPGNLDALTGLSKAEQARERSAAEARRRAEEDGRLKDFRRLLESGQANLANKRYDAAVLALNEALKLKPGDPSASQARAQAEKARQQAALDAGAAAEGKRKAEAYQKAMGEGRVALSGRQYDAAIKAFSAAQKQQPGDQASTAFLREAQKGRDGAQAALAAEAKKRADEAQRAVNVQKAVAAGRTALAAGNMQGAADAFAAAAKLAPQDPTIAAAQNDLRKAQQARAEAQAAAQAAALKQKQADAQRAEQVQRSLTAGRAALKAGQFDAATKSFAEAQKLAPQDPGVGAAFRELDQARQTATAATEKAARQANYQKALQAGQQALAAKRYDDAVKAFGDAGRLLPGDATAANLLNQARAAADAARAAQDAEGRKRAAEQQRQAEFNRLLAQGQAASAAKRHADAVKAYQAALKIRPGDPGATQALQQATAALNAASRPAPPPPPPPQPSPQARAAYAGQMQAGAALDKQQKFADAAKAYQEALKFIPGDAAATYAVRMAQGRVHQGARRFPEAVREFQAALQVRPNDPTATDALNRARAGRP